MGRLRLFGFFGRSCFATFAGLWCEQVIGESSHSCFIVSFWKDFRIDILKDSFERISMQLVQWSGQRSWFEDSYFKRLFRFYDTIVVFDGTFHHFSSNFCGMLLQAFLSLRPAKYQPQITDRKETTFWRCISCKEWWCSIVMLVFGGASVFLSDFLVRSILQDLEARIADEDENTNVHEAAKQSHNRC